MKPLIIFASLVAMSRPPLEWLATNGPSGPAPKACTTAADCKGILPHFCRQCPNGGSACMHWECDEGQCKRQVCPG